MLQTKLALVGPSEMAKLIAKRLRTLRLLKGWTRNTLALRAGVTASPAYFTVVRRERAEIA